MNFPRISKIKTFQKGTLKNPNAIVIGSPIIGTQEKKANQKPNFWIRFSKDINLFSLIPNRFSHKGLPNDPIK